MFRDIFIKKSIKSVIFLVIYTLLFVSFFATLKYTLPFVIGFAVSILVRPLSKYLKNKLPFSKKVSSVVSALLSTLLVFSILISVVSFSLYKIIDEIRMFVINLPDLETMLHSVEKFTGDLGKYYDFLDFSKFDLDLAQKFYSQISGLASSALNVTKYLMNTLISVLVGLPMIIAIGFMSFLSTFFFSKDMPNIESKILSAFTSRGRVKARKIFRESKSMLASYLKSYLYLMSLTFCETLLGLTILGVDYSIILSIITAVVDLLPVLGAGSIYIPMAIYFYFKGQSFISIGLIVMFVVVSVVRQIAEPKLVSTNVGIHPLVIIASIFIGLKSFGILGVIYFISTALIYKIFQKVEIL